MGQFSGYLNNIIKGISPIKIIIFFGAIAAIIRLILLPTVLYGAYGELYRDLAIIWRMYHSLDIPLLGPSSALGGFYFGAIYYYIEAIFVGLWQFRPYGAIFASVFFSLLSLPLVYAICRRWFQDLWVAVLAVIIQSIALFDIQNAYYISNPNLLPFFLLFFLLILTKLLQEGKTWQNYLFLGLIMGVGTQLHATGLIMFWLIFLGAHLYKKIKPSLIQSVIFVLSMGVLYVPYFIYEFRYNFALTKALFSISNRAMAYGSRGDSIFGLINFFGSLLVFKDGFFTFYPSYKLGFAVAIIFSIFLLGIAFWLMVFKKFKPRLAMLNNEAKLIICLWLFGSVFMYLMFPVSPAYYYFLVLWPLPIILFSWWLASLRGFLKKGFWASAGIYLILQLWCLGFFYYHIHKPDYSYGRLSQVFSYIKKQPDSSRSLILNDVLDVNQFNYYLTMYGFTSNAFFSKNAQIFALRSCKDRVKQINLRNIKNSKAFGNICVDFYTK